MKILIIYLKITYFLKLTKELLKDIDANIILEQKKLYRDYKVRILKGKYEKDFDKHITFKDGIIYFDDKKEYHLLKSSLHLYLLYKDSDL